MTTLIAVLTGLAVWLVLAQGSWPATPLRRSGLLPRSLRLTVLALLGTATAALVAELPPRRMMLALIVLASVADLARRFRRRRRRAESLRRSALLLDTCESLAADLQAGRPPVLALEAAADDWPEFTAVARAAQLGADVPEAMRALATLPGAGQARVVAAAWQVAHRVGSGLAPALELAARTVREEQATAAVVATELAAARSTAALLAVMPVVVLAIGSGTGGDPVGFLLDSVPGLFCLSGGLLLAHLGLAWLDLIADGVAR